MYFNMEVNKDIYIYIALDWENLFSVNLISTMILVVDQPTQNIFLRHGGVIEGTNARSITNRIRNNVWVDATVTFDFEGHFKDHKA